MKDKASVNSTDSWELPLGWRITTIENLCTRITSGATPLRSNPIYYDGGTINWYKTGELKDWYLDEADEKITPQALTDTSVKLFPPTTILMAMYGDGKTITSLGILRKEATSNQACCALMANTVICDYLFLFYALKYHRQDFIHAATGGAQRNLSGKIIRSFAIRVPPLPEQRAIAHILGSLDDKIELNRQMNVTLENLARAIFKSWFVDFDPVYTKLALSETERANGEQPVGMDATTAALFPDDFEASELGMIPKGWRVEPIGNIVKVVGGGTPSTKNNEYWENGVHYFATPKDMSSLSAPILLETERKVTDAGLGKISSGLLPVGTVLLSSRAPVGYLALAQVPVCINQGFIAMICNGPVSNYYILNWTLVNMDIIKGRASGTTFAEISKQNFRPILALVPPKKVIKAFDEQVSPLYTQMTLALQETRTLAELRDTLLPKLISGEVRVPEVERFVAEVS